MSASAQGYVITAGNTWRAYGDGSTVARQGGSAQSHAERVAWGQISGRPGPAWLIDQDAFPCWDGCHQFFLQQSRSQPIIIKVTADNTYDGASYTQQGLVAVLGNYPHYLYYRNGTATVASGAPNPPAGFPTHPDPSTV